MRALALGVLLLVCAYLTRDTWTAHIAASQLARALDADVTIGDVAWSGLARVELRELAVTAHADRTAPLRAARVRELVVELDAFAVLRRGLAGIASVRARGVDVALDLRSPSHAPPADAAPADALSFALPAGLPHVELAAVTLHAELVDGAALALEHARIALAPEGDGVRIDAVAPVLAVHAGGRTHAGAFASSSVVEPGALTLSACSWDGLVDSARADLRRESADGALIVHAHAAGRGAELRAAARIAGGRARVSAELHANAIERWLEFAGVGAAGALTGAVDADVHADVPLGDPAALSGGLDLVGRGLVFRGTAVEWLHADVRADARRVFVPELALLSGANELALSEVVLPERWNEDCAWIDGTAGRFEIHVRDAAALPLPVDAPHLDALDSAGTWADGLAQITSATLTSASGVCHVRSGTLPLALDTRLFTHPRAALDLELDVGDLADFAPFAGGHALTGALHADALLHAQPRGPAGHVVVEARDVNVDGQTFGDASLSALVDASLFDIEQLTLRTPLGELHARGRVDVAGRRCEGVSVEGTLAIGNEIASAPQNAGQSAAAGSARVSARIDGVWPELDGWLHLDARDESAGQRAALDVRLVRGELTIDELTFRSARTELHARGTCANLASLAGEPRSACARVETLSGTFAESAFELRRAVDVTWGPGRLALETVELHTALGTLTADCDWSAQHARLRAHSTGEVALELDVDVPLALTSGGALDTSGDAHLRAHVAAEDLAQVTALAELAGRKLSGRLTLDAELAGSARALRGKLAISAQAVELAGLLDPWLARAGLAGPLTVTGEIDATDDITLRSLRLDHSHVHAELDGKLAGPLDLTALIADGRHAWEHTPLDLRVRASGDELAPLAAIAPVLRRVGGRFALELALRGTAADPEVHGTATLEGGELRLAALPVPWTRLDARLAFDARKLTIESLHGELGGAPFEAHGDIWPFEAEPHVDFELAGDNLLIVRTPDLRLRADTELRVTGPLARARVSGEFALRGSHYERDFDVLSRIGSRRASGHSERVRPLFELDPPLDTLTFDVRVRAAEPFRIDNGIVRSGLRPEIMLGGTGALPLVTGRILLEPGTVRLPAANVRIVSGSLEYLATDPFVPHLEALAEARVQGYDITLRASGRLQEPVVELSSIPPLSQEDLVMLVLTGVAPSTQVGARSGDIVTRNMSVYVARDVLRDWLDGDLGKLLLDSLEVETSEEMSRTGVESVRARMLVKRLDANGQRNLFLTGERDVYEHYNFGVRIVFKFP